MDTEAVKNEKDHEAPVTEGLPEEEEMKDDGASVVPAKTNDGEEKRPFYKEVLEFLCYLAAAAVICFLIITFIAVRSIVDGGSMNPLLQDGDNLIVEKVTYYFRDPARFDVIVFELENEPGTHYIKRIIGLPGETVRIADGIVYINGEPLDSDVYGNAPIEKSYRASSDVVLGEEEYFVMGDNRNRSQDSRTVYVGNVHKKQFVGRAWLRFWPFSKFGTINP